MLVYIASLSSPCADSLEDLCLCSFLFVLVFLFIFSIHLSDFFSLRLSFHLLIFLVVISSSSTSKQTNSCWFSLRFGPCYDLCYFHNVGFRSIP